MGAEQHVELVVGIVGDLQAAGEFVIAAHILAAGRQRVVDPVVTVLPKHGCAGRHARTDGAADRAIKRCGAERAVGSLRTGIELLAWPDGREANDAGCRVATKQRALRAAIDLDTLDIENRRRLENHVLHHDVVHDDRDGLGCSEIEVGVAEAADVEARGDPSVRAFGVERWHAGGKRQHVLTRGEDCADLVVRQGRCRDRHFLQIFLALVGRDDHDIQTVLGFLRGGRYSHQRHGRDGRHQAQQRVARGSHVAQHHGRHPYVM